MRVTRVQLWKSIGNCFLEHLNSLLMHSEEQLITLENVKE